jgi:hypothetical protein
MSALVSLAAKVKVRAHQRVSPLGELIDVRGHWRQLFDLKALGAAVDVNERDYKVRKGGVSFHIYRSPAGGWEVNDGISATEFEHFKNALDHVVSQVRSLAQLQDARRRAPVQTGKLSDRYTGSLKGTNYPTEPGIPFRGTVWGRSVSRPKPSGKYKRIWRMGSGGPASFSDAVGALAVKLSRE